MKTKKKYSIYIVFAFIFCILYLLFAAKPLGKEYQFIPEWKTNITIPVRQTTLSSEEMIYFKLGQSLGYFTSEGNISLMETYPSKASISSEYYAVYNTENNPIKFFNKYGIEQGTLEKSGFPFFEENRIFIFLPGGNSFSMCNDAGNVIWTNESTLPITAFSSKQNYTTVGYADGSIKVIENKSGNTDIEYLPGGSDYNVIFGIDISDDGNYIASVSGHNKQRFVLAQIENNQPKIIFHKYLDSDLNKQTIVKFCDNNKKIIYNYQNAIGIYNIKSNENIEIKIDKQIISIEETDDLIFALGKDGNNYTIYIIEKTDTLEGSFDFTANSAFIKTLNNNLFVGQDTFISKIKISKE